MIFGLEDINFFYKNPIGGGVLIYGIYIYIYIYISDAKLTSHGEMRDHLT